MVRSQFLFPNEGMGILSPLFVCASFRSQLGTVGRRASVLPIATYLLLRVVGHYGQRYIAMNPNK